MPIDNKTFFGIAILCGALVTAPGSIPAQQRFEVMHFWTNGSEQQAINIIRDEFVRRHEAEWVDTGLPSYDAVRKRILKRIIDGYPPDAVLWHPGPEAWQLHEMQLIHTLTDLANEQKWRDKFSDTVLKTIRHGDEFVAVPTSIHGESLVWYSTEIYKKLELDYPESWEQLLEQADAIHKAGYIAVAIGEPEWEKRVLFSVILNSLNPHTYLELFKQGSLPVTRRPEVLRAFRIMARLRDASPANTEQASWAEASQLIGQARAGMLFTGDWVNEIFKGRGWKLGVDYECRVVPGDRSAYMFVVDGFVMPVSADPQPAALRHRFAEVVLDPAVQVEFALKKGAVPAVRGLSDPRFDKCSRFTIEALQDDDKLIPSSASLNTTTYANAVQFTVAELWQSDMTPEQALALLREELMLVREFESSGLSVQFP